MDNSSRSEQVDPSDPNSKRTSSLALEMAYLVDISKISFSRPSSNSLRSKYCCVSKLLASAINVALSSDWIILADLTEDLLLDPECELFVRDPDWTLLCLERDWGWSGVRRPAWEMLSAGLISPCTDLPSPSVSPLILRNHCLVHICCSLNSFIPGWNHFSNSAINSESPANLWQ